MENPIKMDDLGVLLFLETPICQHPEYHIPKNTPKVSEESLSGVALFAVKRQD